MGIRRQKQRLKQQAPTGCRLVRASQSVRKNSGKQENFKKKKKATPALWAQLNFGEKRMKGLELEEEEAEKTGLQEEAKMKVNKEFGGFQKLSKYPRFLSRPCGARRGELRLQAHRQWLAIKNKL